VRRTLVLAAVLAGALCVALVLPARRPDAPEAPVRPPRQPAVSARRPGTSTALTSPMPGRNVFEYAEPAPSAAARAAPMPVASPPAEPPLPAAPEVPAVRLVGLVHRGGKLRAAISILGDVVVLAAGEESEGYRVLSVDEESGVRLRMPDGSEQSFARPEAP
jgi:hypothetical protein